MWKTWQVLQDAPIPEAEEEMPVYRALEDPKAFQVFEDEDEEGWRVTGKMIERADAMTYWEQPGSVRRFQRLMKGLGVDKALREAGIQEGETVHIGEWDLEWVD